MSAPNSAQTRAVNTPQATHPGNNFDAIRIVAAIMVLVSHHYALTGQMEPSFFGIYSLGGLAVTIFFIISGYLVTSSWQRDPNVWRFALRRFLRIWPALTFTIVATAYVLGAWVTELPLKEYLTHRATANYLYSLWMNIHFVLPGVFEHNPYALGVNGSLWTIPFEVRCYVVLGLAGLVGLLKYRLVFLSLIAIFMGWFLLRSNADITGAVHYGRELSAFFLAGAALHTLEPYWSRRPAIWTIVISIAFAVVWMAGWRHTALLMGLPLAIIYAATRSTPLLRHAGRWGDPSYGIYLFAFPIQQTVILNMWPDAGFIGTLAMSLSIAVALAYASWHFLEKQALKFKPKRRLPGTLAISLRTIRQRLSHLPWTWFWPLLACVVGLRFCIKRLNAPVLIDPAYSYLPAARALLDQGWSFLLQPESYRMPPLAYLWPALWGVDTTWIRIANMGLWVACVWFLWRTCCLIGGQRAAAVAMLLLLSPELVRYFPTEMTEPLYLFGVFGWMYAAACIIIGRERSTAVVVLGAGMLTITLLARPVLQFIAPAALLGCLCCLAYWSRPHKGISNPPLKQPVLTFSLSLGFGLALPLAFLIKNGVVFGLWGLGTGSGIGLYLGTHPLFQGAEPGFLGFDFDVNLMAALAGQASHSHSLAADWATRQAALWQLQSMSLVDSIAFFGRKLWWWLAHHPAQIEAFGSSLRKLRFFELAVVGTAILWLLREGLRRTTSTRCAYSAFTRAQWSFAAFMMAMFLVMLVQLLPILYNSRYSAALLDPWLIPMTAFGIAFLTAPISQEISPNTKSRSSGATLHQPLVRWPSVAALTAILILTFGGYSLAHKYEHISIDPMHMGQTIPRLEISASERITTIGMDAQGAHLWVTTESPATLAIHIDQSDVEQIGKSNIFNALWETQIALNAQGKRCKTTETSYKNDDGRILQPAEKLSLFFPLPADGVLQSLVTHANRELRPRAPGSLLLTVNCPVGTVLEWRGTRLLESRHAWNAAAHVIQKNITSAAPE